MSTSSQQSRQPNSGVHPFAYVLVASGGGVVGTDYATWLKVDPVVGAVIGGLISLIMLSIANKMYRDPGGEIQKKCMEIGGGIGLLLGAVIIGSNFDHIVAWIIGGIVGSAIGYKVGEIAAAIISLAGFAVLLLSQGPIGLAVRTAILNSN